MMIVVLCLLSIYFLKLLYGIFISDGVTYGRLAELNFRLLMLTFLIILTLLAMKS